MKVLKQTLTLFALVALFSTTAYAQENANVTASATVQSAFTMNNVNDLSFGTITTTETPTISATDANAGAVDIVGASSGVLMDVTIDYPATLDNADVDATNDLVFGNYEGSYRLDGTNDATGSTTFGTVSGTQLTGSFTSTANTMYIYVGGQITDASQAVPGDPYSNTITVTVDYN